jgi:dTDP-glucose pyrophosphorylase
VSAAAGSGSFCTTTQFASLCVAPEGTIREALDHIDTNRKGIVLVVDDRRRLLGTLTDGDLRRAILAGCGLDTPASAVLQRKAAAAPVTAPIDADHATLLASLREHTIRQLPLLDAEGCVAGLVMLDDLLPEEVLPLQAVIMAGGFGKRLHPLTESMPKPMLHVGDKPVMELIVNQLREAGIRTVNVTTHFEPDKIKDHFGDGSGFGVAMNYVAEDSPLGTAGALSLMDDKAEPLLVINGDILTEVDFRALLAFHREHGADLTVGVRQYDFQVPYGVIESDGVEVTGVHEKPVLNFFVNAGIYLLEPSVHAHIPQGERFDMTDLIKRLLAEGRPVASFPIVEYWLDIGQHADYQRAQEDVKSGKFGS